MLPSSLSRLDSSIRKPFGSGFGIMYVPDGTSLHLDHWRGFTVAINLTPEGVSVDIFPLVVVDAPLASLAVTFEQINAAVDVADGPELGDGEGWDENDEYPSVDDREDFHSDDGISSPDYD